MSRTYTQKDIYDYLKANPFNTEVWIGDLYNMNGKDYIFLNYISERNIPSDNAGCYITSIQIDVYTKDLVKRKRLVDYIKGLSQFSVSYMPSNEGNYFVAQMSTELFINNEY